MRPVRGVIFDCDGVLFESRQANLDYYNAVLDRLGAGRIDADRPELVHLCHTAASPRVFEVLLGPGLAPEALALARELDYRQFIPALTPEPDLVPSLARLAASLPLAVATNRGDSVGEILAHFRLTGYFRTVVTSRDVPRPKPYPDMLRLAAGRLGLVADELLFVGDSELDREAARGAGMHFLAYRGKVDQAPAVGGHAELADLVLGGGEAPSPTGAALSSGSWSSRGHGPPGASGS